MATIDEQIDALLASMEGRNLLELHALIHERRRKVAHAKAKAVQPAMGLRGPTPHVSFAETLKASWSTPITDEDADAGQGAMEDLLLTVQDVVNAEPFDPEDMVFALVRIGRKAWAWQRGHLGPIEGIKT